MPRAHLQTLVHCEEKRERAREGRRVIRVTPHGGREARKSGDHCNASAVWSCSGGRAEERAGIMEPASHHTACANPTNRSGILLFCFFFFLLSLFEKFQCPPWRRFESKDDDECADLFSRFLCSVVCRNESGKINSASRVEEHIMYVSIALCRRLLRLQ